MLTSFNFFFGSPSSKNSKVWRAWLETVLGWVTDREVLLTYARMSTKYIEKTSVGMWLNDEFHTRAVISIRKKSKEIRITCCPHIMRYLAHSGLALPMTNHTLKPVGAGVGIDKVFAPLQPQLNRVPADWMDNARESWRIEFHSHNNLHLGQRATGTTGVRTDRQYYY